MAIPPAVARGIAVVMPHPFSAEIVPLMFPFSFSVDIVDSEYAFETFENLLSGVQFYFSLPNRWSGATARRMSSRSIEFTRSMRVSIAESRGGASEGS